MLCSHTGDTLSVLCPYPAVLQPAIWNPRSSSTECLPALLSNCAGLSCPPAGWTIRGDSPDPAVSPYSPTQGCSVAIWGQCGCHQVGALKVLVLDLLPGCPQDPFFSLHSLFSLHPTGTYVWLEAPTPKLLLLICNPLQAGGKGIWGD